jgi:non-homologous end joining protein Ku
LPASGRNEFNQRALTLDLFQQGGARPVVRKLIEFDDDTFDKLTQLGRDRMATIQELADEAFADVLKKHGIPIDLKDALRKSAALPKSAAHSKTKSRGARKAKS